jgi:hypothetical protein
MLKKILVAVLLLLLAFVIVVALQPAEFSVRLPFVEVVDMGKHVGHGGREGPPEGAGTVITWSGNDKVGEGKMTLVDSAPDEHDNIEVDFVKPFEGSINSGFGFKPDGGQTQVNWTMSGHHDFMGKAFCLVMNGTKMMAGDIDKGLAQLKSVVEGASGP